MLEGTSENCQFTHPSLSVFEIVASFRFLLLCYYVIIKVDGLIRLFVQPNNMHSKDLKEECRLLVTAA